MEQKEFITLNGKHCREKKTSLVELMSIVDYYNSNDLDKVETINRFALEHLEVEIEGVWVPVKAKGKENYMPVDLADDIIEMRDMIQWYLKTVLNPVFQKSVESMKKRAALTDKDKK